jgi:HK97 family phage prohead protease
MAVATEERRHLPLASAGVAIRAADDGVEKFTGLAAVFNSRTSIGNPLRWGWYEEIASGAFTKTLDEGDARMLIDHDTYYIVSRVSADTLRLDQGERGLAVDSDLDAELSYVGDLKANLRNGNLSGMSFGFQVVKDDWSTIDVETTDGDTVEAELRVIREVKLFEVSAVTFPAYEETEAGLRSAVAVLAHRGDQAALERRASCPEFIDLLRARDREPGKPTRADADVEPAVSTRLTVAHADLRMRELAARYGLPR